VEGGRWGAEVGAAKSVPIGGKFWASVDGDGAEFSEEDKKLLQAIYDPNLSDRRAEGERFVPLDASEEYVQKLHMLVKEEEERRQQRIDHFFSSEFCAEKPGPLFPHTWAPSVKIARGQNSAVSGSKIHARPDYKILAQKLLPALKSVTPTFDKMTEEGASASTSWANWSCAPHRCQMGRRTLVLFLQKVASLPRREDLAR